jgi:hypothetical protein
MPTILSDTFAGSGALAGRTPDTTFGSQSWVLTTNEPDWPSYGGSGSIGSNAGINQTGGKAVSATTTNVASYGAARLGTDNVSFGNGGVVEITFAFTVASDISTYGGVETALGMYFGFVDGVDSKGMLLRIIGDANASNWTVALFPAGQQAMANFEVFSVTAGSTYTVTVNINPNGESTVNINGNTFTTYDSLGYATGSLSAVMMRIGFTNSVDNLLITGSVSASGAVANLTAPMPVLVATGSPVALRAELTAPMPVLLASGRPFNGSALTIPVPTIRALGGGSARMTAPSLELYADGHDASFDNYFNYTLPALQLTARGGANIALSLSPPTVQVTGSFWGSGSARLEAPSLLLSSSGTVSGSARAALTFGNGTSTYKLVGYSGSVISVSLSGAPTIAAKGTSGNVGGARLTLPLYQLTASATVRTLSTVELLLPAVVSSSGGIARLMAPLAQLSIIGEATVVVTNASYEAYAVNLNHTPSRKNPNPVDEVTHYTNYPFDRIVRYQNSYYGMNATGLYLLEGTTDHGTPPTPISWAFRTALEDFGSGNMKNVSSVYFGGSLAPEATIDVFVGETAAIANSFTTPRGALVQNYRQPTGRGMRGRYYAFGASGEGTLNVRTMTLNVTELTRKV